MKTQLPRRASRLTAAGTSAAMVATAMVAFSPVGPAHAAATSQTFNYLNEAQTFIVPSGTQTLSVTAYGAAGGNAGSPGGQGGMTKATINVAGKSSLSVNVGGKGGGTVGGFNGGASGGTGRASGAGGGGATDIRYSGTRLLVAPGGGGGGGNSRIHTGGKGGTGSQAGTAGVVGGGGKNAGAGGAAATQTSGVGTAGGNGQSRKTGSGGGGGGGGGGYKAGSGGGGGKSPLVGIAGAGGGGGSGSAYVVTGATNVSYASGGSGGNGIATLSWIDITTDSLPDGQVSQPYVGQLSAVGNSGAMTWSVTSGTLPLGLSLDASTGAISGVPTTQEVTTATFSVSDTQGKISTVPITFDIHASNAIVVDGPATDITQTTATGNATVTPDGINAVTAIYCRISTSSTMSPYTQVDAATPPVPLSAGAGPTAATCPFTDLVANTKYYYVAYAVDSSVNSSNKASVFTTTAKANQTADIAPPAFIKPLGVTVLMAKSTLTNDGQKVEVLTSRVLKPRPRGDLRPWYRMVYLASGGVAVRTYDRGPFYFRVVYRAPGDATYNPWQYVRTYLVK